jgi:hypothetical protein
MNFLKGKATITQLQLLIWTAVYLITFFTYLPEDGFVRAASYTQINTAFYLALIYGNIKFLLPRLYERGQKALYVICVIVLLVGGGLIRGYILIYISNKFGSDMKEEMNLSTGSYFIMAGFLTYVLSFVFRIAIAYFTLKQQSEKILAQKSQAELNLLKSQVQPHFLFNTLNNIYYEAYLEAPRTAELIERLSDIMRYFVDESPKDEVSLATEVQFIENYIALEKIRIRHETEIIFIKDYSNDVRIPPMLLMTFVENIFKHGIDKSSSENKIDISLIYQDDYLLFQTRNRIHGTPAQTASHGFGIQNLRRRLALLYDTRFELNIEQTEHCFTAFLKVPLS